MCGLTAYFNKTKKFEMSQNIARMAKLIDHRGPDGTALYYKLEDGQSYIKNILQVPDERCKIILAHNRLSIIDLSDNGNQPFVFKSLKIIFNGEIYNYIELRKWLIDEYDEDFYTETDTEVLIKLYYHLREEALDLLDGMYSFVIYDESTNEVFAARDEFGIKPLYYFVNSNGLYFFSEIKQALLGCVSEDWYINKARVYDFLNRGLSDHTIETMVTGVYQLPPGHYFSCMVQDVNNLRNFQNIPTVCFYAQDDAELKVPISTAVNKFREIFETSILLRMRADVSIGACLSGGIDSSSIVSFMCANAADDIGRSRIHTFSLRSKNILVDEGEFIKTVTNKYDVIAKNEFLEDTDFFEELKRCVYVQDEPFSTGSIVAQNRLFQLAALNGVKVILDGQGSDEFLYGYEKFINAFNYSKVFSKPVLGKVLTILKLIILRKVNDENITPIKFVVYNSWLMRNISHIKSQISSPFRDSRSLSTSAAKDMYDAHSSCAALSNAMIAKINLPKLLHWEDRNSMAASVEARVPFLSKYLVAYATALPTNYKLRDSQTKFILREAAKTYLPSKIYLRRDKKGFIADDVELLKNIDADLLLTVLKNGIKNYPVLFRPKLLKTAQYFLCGRNSDANIIIRALTTIFWIEQFNLKVGK